MKTHLAVLVIGKRNSGKSSSWYSLMGQQCKTGAYERLVPLELAGMHVSAFLVNGSFTETGSNVPDKLQGNWPKIILASEQYHQNAFQTVDYLDSHGYELFVIWLNPGAGDTDGYDDDLGLIDHIMSLNGTVVKLPGGAGAEAPRTKAVAQVIREKVFGWAHFH